MNVKKKKRRPLSAHLLPILFMLPFGAIFGFFLGRYTEEFFDQGRPFHEIIFAAALLFFILYFIILIQIILHEGGHLIFGLLTGYRFSSFRIGSFMWIKEEDSIKLKRFALAGTGGQCLMAPPDYNNGNFPYLLYNMGGPIMNLIVFVLFGGISFYTKDYIPVSAFFFISAIMSLMISLMNGLPLKLDLVNNDGYNALSLGKNKENLRSFWIQMKLGELSTKGVPAKDMPEEWFVMPSPESLKNGMNAFLAVICCSKMIEEKKFDEAEETISRLLLMDTAIAGLHRSMMAADGIYCRLVGTDITKDPLELMDKQQKKMMKIMRHSLSIQRTEYALALLLEQNEEKAGKIEKTFEKTVKNYPYQADIIIERKLLEFAKQRYEGKKNEASRH